MKISKKPYPLFTRRVYDHYGGIKVKTIYFDTKQNEFYIYNGAKKVFIGRTSDGKFKAPVSVKFRKTTK